MSILSPHAGYLVLFGVAAIACFLCLPRTRRIDNAEIRNGIAALLATSGAWAGAHVGYLAAPTPGLQYAFYALGLVVGLAAVIPWLYFCSAYTGRSLHRNARVRWTAIGVFLVIIAVKLTNPLHHLYFTAETVTTPFPHLLIVHQPIHWVVMGLAYALAFVGFFMLFELFVRVSSDTKPLIVVFGLAGVPVVFDVLGAATPYLLELTYSPLGVAAFAVGAFYVYFEQFQTVRLTGDADDPTIVLDGQTRIREFNRPARTLFPALAGATNAPLEEVLPEVAAVLAEPDPILELGTAPDVRYYRVTESSFTAGRTRLGGLLTLTDVTEREGYRRELERQHERLERFASVISHDLRNPLSVAKGYLEVAREEHDSVPLEEIEHSLERMELLIADVLTLARQGADVSEMEPIDLAAVCEECWDGVDTASATLDLRVDRTIRGDRSRLRQLLENLLRNAIDHGGETVTITIEALEDGFAVEDDGPGIPAEHRDQVLEFGHSSTSEGTGLGLSIVEGIATAHGWNVRVTDGSDGGARFEITGVETVGPADHTGDTESGDSEPGDTESGNSEPGDTVLGDPDHRSQTF